MIEVTFHFGASRKRDMPAVPRPGDSVIINDDPDQSVDNPQFVSLRVDSILWQQEGKFWDVIANCTVLADEA